MPQQALPPHKNKIKRNISAFFCIEHAFILSYTGVDGFRTGIPIHGRRNMGETHTQPVRPDATPSLAPGGQMARFRIVLDFIRQHKPSYIAGMMCMLVASYIQTLFPNVLGDTIDVMGAQGFSKNAVWRNIGFIMAIAVATFAFTFLWRTLVIGNARKLECDLRARLFQHFLLLSPSFYHHRKTGDLLAYAINDISAVRMTFGPATAMSVNSLVIIAASVATMVATVDRRLTLLVLLPFPFVIWAMLRIGREVRRSFLTVQQSFAAISGKVNEGIHGIRVIKAYVQEEPTLADFRATSQGMVEASVKMVSTSSLLGPIIEVCFSLSFAMNLILGGRMVLDGTITVGAFVAFNTYLAMIIAPVLGIGRIVNIFQRGIASMDRLNEVFLTNPDITDRPGAIDTHMTGALKIRDLDFRYGGTAEPAPSVAAHTAAGNPESSPSALRIHKLDVPAGNTLGIIGTTGCGKTTLANLLLRAYDTREGSILLDDRPLTAYTLETLRNSIAYVSQEPFLFSATIRENIACFRDGYSDDAILQAVADSSLLDTIKEMPQGLDTLLGERGVNLSGGQKQRVAIARALLRDAPLLILDDALSAVDTVTEASILERLRQRRRNRTTLLISHRISAVADTDQILVLHNGEVTQMGTHHQLLTEGGLYRAIYDEQEESRHDIIRQG
jgi:ATP-binding cassette, subfamily B, multidrug efflux pump